MSAHLGVFAWKLKLSGWPPGAVCLFCTFEDGKEREIMWRVFALLIYGKLSCKLKLKRLDIDVKRHFCSTINLSYLGSWVSPLTLSGYFQFLNLISILSCLREKISILSQYSIVIWWQITTWQLEELIPYFDLITFYKRTGDQECSQCKIIVTFLQPQPQIQFVLLAVLPDHRTLPVKLGAKL